MYEESEIFAMKSFEVWAIILESGAKLSSTCLLHCCICVFYHTMYHNTKEPSFSTAQAQPFRVLLSPRAALEL